MAKVSGKLVVWIKNVSHSFGGLLSMVSVLLSLSLVSWIVPDVLSRLVVFIGPT